MNLSNETRIRTAVLRRTRGSRSIITLFLCLVFLPSALLLPKTCFAQDPVSSKRPETRVEGRIVAFSAEPVAGATVFLELGSDTRALEGITDASGMFAFTIPRGGSFRLKVTKAGFRDAGIEPLQVTDGEIRKIELTLERDGASNKSADSPDIPKPLQLSDEPNYSVAGVTDWSNVGLHGSDSNVRTSEKLAKDTASMRSSAAGKPAAVSVADSHRILGDEKEKSGDPVAALREYEKAVKLEPTEENYFALGAELLLHRGGSAAVEVFQKAAVAHPKSARIQAGLGSAYYADGQYDQAADRICQAADLSPNDPAPYLFLGSMEKASTEILPCSEMRLKRFVKSQPQNPQANYYYGVVLLKLGRGSPFAEYMKSAEEYFKKAILLAPTFGEAYVELGLVYNARGERAPALAAFQKAAEVAPKLAAAHYNASLAYRRVGETEKAEQELALYDQLHKSDEVELEKERRQLRQFVTILKSEPNAAGSTPQ